MSIQGKFHVIRTAYKNTQNKKSVFKKAYEILTNEGLSTLKDKIFEKATKGQMIVNVQTNIYQTQQSEKVSFQELNQFITVVVLVKNNHADITGTLMSLKEQVYKNFNIKLVKPSQYKYSFEIENLEAYNYEEFSSDYLNKIINTIEGDSFIILNEGNSLSRDALLCFAKSVEKEDMELVYCDECIYDCVKGDINEYIFKPEFSPVYLHNKQYMEEGVLFNTKKFNECGGFCNSLTDFRSIINSGVVNLTSKKVKVEHIERILLVRNSYNEKNFNGKNSIEDANILKSYYLKDGISASVIPDSIGKGFTKELFCEGYPKVSLVLLSDNEELSKRLINSIIDNTLYIGYEIVLVANSALCENIRNKFNCFDNIRFHSNNEKFNYSQRCNEGFKESSGEIVLFIHDNVLIERNDWLQKIVDCFTFKEVGGVSPKVLRMENTIRYAGVISGGFGLFPIPFNGEQNVIRKNFNELVFTNREVSVLSATCLAVRREVFEKIEGFNQIDTSDKFSNADISFKIMESGYSCVYCGESEIFVNQGNWYDSWFERESDIAYIYMLKRWINRLKFDPYFTKSMKMTMLKNLPIDYSIYYNEEVPSNHSDSSKNILLVTHELSMTGAPIALHYAAKALKENGDYPVIISPCDGNLKQEILSDGIPVIIDCSIMGSSFWIKFVKNFDLIIVNTLVFSPQIKTIMESNVPILWWVHEANQSYVLGANKTMPKDINDDIHVYCAGIYAQRMLQKYRPSYKSDVLLYGLPDFSKTSNELSYKLDNIMGKKVFATVGTIEDRKGQDIMIEAITNMPPSYIERGKFLFIGRNCDSAIYNKIKQAAYQYPDNIMLISEVKRNEVMDIYKQCACVICASRDDPMPVFMTEAMMLSKICICSENTGTATLIEDGINGFTYKNNDYKELMKKMMYVIDKDDSEIEDISKEGRKVYEKYFSMDVFNENIVKIVNSIN